MKLPRKSGAHTRHDCSSLPFTFIDLFAGIGGMRQSFEQAGGACAFTSEWNKFAQETYRANFDCSRHAVAGDITKVPPDAIPPHDILLAGFPCQPFSLAGIGAKNKSGHQHERLDTVQPPQPGSFPQISLPQSFAQAKKLLTNKVYANDNERQTFYCGCNYSREGKIDPLSCGYEPKRPGSARSKRLEWEHIVPASYIGRGRSCWETGAEECKNSKGKPYKGRRCCEKVDAQFRQITADLNNLVPEIGELNSDRSNFPHGEIAGEKREYGACDFEVDTTLKEAEPAVPLRGFIGRTWLYMHETYGVWIAPEDMKVYQAWAEAYPPKGWEVNRQKRIRKLTQTAD